MGGGAGIRFTIKNVSCDVTCTLQEGTLNILNIETDVSLPKSFSAEGYDDGMSNVRINLLNYEIKLDKLALTRELQEIINLDDYNTITKLEFTINMDYEEMRFGGYVRGNFTVNDIVVDEFDYNESIELYVYEKDEQNNGKETWDRLYTNIDIKNIIESTSFSATEEFVDFYKDVFSYNGPKEVEIYEYISEYYSEELEKDFEDIGVEQNYSTKEDYLKSLSSGNYLYERAENEMWDNHWVYCRDDYSVN